MIRQFGICFRVHPFARKEWYEVRAPIMFEKRSCSLTPVTKTMGTSNLLPALNNICQRLQVMG